MNLSICVCVESALTVDTNVTELAWTRPRTQLTATLQETGLCNFTKEEMMTRRAQRAV